MTGERAGFPKGGSSENLYLEICVDTARAIGFKEQVKLPFFGGLVKEALKRATALLGRAPRMGGELILVRREFVRALADLRISRIAKAHRRITAEHRTALRERIIPASEKTSLSAEELRVALDPVLWGLRELVETELYLGADEALAALVNRLNIQDGLFKKRGQPVQDVCTRLGT